MDQHEALHRKWDNFPNAQLDTFLCLFTVGNKLVTLRNDPFKETPLATGDHLTEEQNLVLRKLLSKFVELFPTLGVPNGISNVTPIYLDTGKARPIFSQPRQLPQKQREIFEKEIKKLLEQKIIEVSTSAW